jgi:flavin reductase (DIM6/NTAB) family NADH-FMN oxidoreductase RutF
MNKVQFGPQTLIYPMPAVLIGAIVEGKPTFMTAAWSGVACSKPPMISVALQPQRYTLIGMRESSAFSINVPSSKMMKEVDYCGIVSGKDSNKVERCGFEIFFGKTEGAPLIAQCPVNLECVVAHTIELGSHFLVIGEVVESHVSADCLTEGKPDVGRIDPLIFSVPGRFYHNLGEVIGRAFKVGLELKGE